MRGISAAVVAGLSVFTAICGPAAIGRADVQCNSQAGNQAAPGFYQEQYNPSVAKPLTKDLAIYHSAVTSGDATQIGQAAGTLYSEIASYPTMFASGVFGCYSPAVLASLRQATDPLAATYDSINGAAAKLGGKSPSDIPGLASQAKPQEAAFVQALNAYASQFGGQQVLQS
jgi:hypothetical protein